MKRWHHWNSQGTKHRVGFWCGGVTSPTTDQIETTGTKTKETRDHGENTSVHKLALIAKAGVCECYSRPQRQNMEITKCMRTNMHADKDKNACGQGQICMRTICRTNMYANKNKYEQEQLCMRRSRRGHQCSI